MEISKILVRNMVTKKEQIRNEFKSTRKKLSKQIVDNNSFEICNNILNSKLYHNCNNILVYSSIQNEIYLNILIEKALTDNKNIYFPRVDGESMEFYKVECLNNLSKGSFEILEPTSSENYKDAANSIILVPGIAFSENGARIGFGKGYYDKYLSCHTFLYKIGVAHDWQITDNWEINEFDINMNMIITETREVFIYE